MNVLANPTPVGRVLAEEGALPAHLPRLLLLLLILPPPLRVLRLPAAGLPCSV